MLKNIVRPPQLLLKNIYPPSADGLIEIDVTESTRAFLFIERKCTPEKTY